MADGSIRFWPTVTFDDLVTGLEQGIGFDRPVAHWIAMRTLSEPDAMPFGAGVIPGLDKWDDTALADHETWRPWRSYVAVALAAAHLRATMAGRAVG